MAALENVVVPRKRLTTYGKAYRKHIPDYNLGAKPHAPEKKQTESLQSASLQTRAPSVTSTEPKKLKSVSRTSPHKSPPSAAINKSNVFDVPSSDDEASSPSSKPTVTAASKAKAPIQRSMNNTGTAVAGPSDFESRKRMKFSPVRPTLQKPNTTKPLTMRPVPESIKNTSKKLQNSLGLGKTATVVARPKPAAAHRRQEEQRTPRKRSPIAKQPSPSTPSPKLRAVPDPMDVDTPGRYISPRGMQMWKELLDATDDDAANDVAMTDVEVSSVHAILAPSPSSKTSHKSAGVMKSARKAPKKYPRRRLIDSLVEQTAQMDDEEESTFEDPDNTPKLDLEPQASSSEVDLGDQTLVPEVPTVPTLSNSQGSQISGPKFTYSRQRSMLAEEDLMQSLALDMPTQATQSSEGRRPRRASIPALKPLASFHEEDEGEDGPATTIKSVHELRQAGANNRFLDEVEDLLDRIGKPTTPPSSMRRSALLDLASKFQDKNFARQFRSNGVEQKLFIHLGQETDIVAGYLIISILMAVLCDASMPHIVVQLRRQGIARLLIRLIESQASIKSVIKDRKSNLSRIAQSLISEHHDYVLKLPIWDDLVPKVLSARTVALKSLEMMVRQTRESGSSGDIISKELTTSLFDIIKSSSEEESWDLPQGEMAIDFHLALSTLESHSIFARTVHDESIWISEFLPIIADALEIALNRPEIGPIQILILRLTLNVTNNNPKASDVFARTSLMATICQVVTTRFKQILRFLTEDELLESVDYLILIQGVMINFAEWSSTARECLEVIEGKDDDSLDAMVRLFVDNKKRTAEADSVEESQKNVAFGYLSVLLGALALSPTMAVRFAEQQPRKTLRPLTESIEEFIGHHKAADMLIEAAEDGYNANNGFTERLECLLAKLSAAKV